MQSEERGEAKPTRGTNAIEYPSWRREKSPPRNSLVPQCLNPINPKFKRKRERENEREGGREREVEVGRERNRGGERERMREGERER